MHTTADGGSLPDFTAGEYPQGGFEGAVAPDDNESIGLSNQKLPEIPEPAPADIDQDALTTGPSTDSEVGGEQPSDTGATLLNRLATMPEQLQAGPPANAIGRNIVSAVTEVGVSDTEAAVDGGNGMLPPETGRNGDEAGEYERPGILRLDGKLWPYGGERPETSESNAARLHTAATALLKNSMDTLSDGERVFGGPFGARNEQFYIRTAAKTTAEQQVHDERVSGRWNGSYNALEIHVAPAHAHGDAVGQLPYYIFRPDALDSEEGFRRVAIGSSANIKRPAGWLEDPITWPIHDAVVIRPIPNWTNGPNYEIITDPAEDSTLRSLAEHLEYQHASAARKKIHDGAFHTFYDNVERAPGRQGLTATNYRFVEVVPKAEADPEIVRQKMELMYEHSPNYLRLTVAPDDDPVAAIEAAQRRVAAELQRTIGLADPRLDLPSINEFSDKLGLDTNTSLVLCQAPDEPVGHYTTWSEKIPEQFVRSDAKGLFLKTPRIATVAVNRITSDVDLNAAVVHELVGHGSYPRELRYILFGNDLYVWPTGAAFNFIDESRAEFLAANYAHIYTGFRGTDYMSHGSLGTIPVVTSDKYALRGVDGAFDFARESTAWELLIGKDPSIFEPFVSGDRAVLQQKVTALSPGLYDLMQRIKTFDDLDDAASTIWHEVCRLHGVTNTTPNAHEKMRLAVTQSHEVVVQAFRRKLAATQS